MGFRYRGGVGDREMKENLTLIYINWDVLQCIDVFHMFIKPRELTLIYTNHNTMDKERIIAWVVSSW